MLTHANSMHGQEQKLNLQACCLLWPISSCNMTNSCCAFLCLLQLTALASTLEFFFAQLASTLFPFRKIHNYVLNMRDYVARNDILFSAQTKTDAIFSARIWISIWLPYEIPAFGHSFWDLLDLAFFCLILFVSLVCVCMFLVWHCRFCFPFKQSFFNNIFPICWLVSLFSIEIDAKQQHIDKE